MPRSEIHLGDPNIKSQWQAAIIIDPEHPGGPKVTLWIGMGQAGTFFKVPEEDFIRKWREVGKQLGIIK